MDGTGRERSWLRRVDQVTIAGLTATGLLLLAGHAWYRGALAGRYLELDRDGPVPALPEYVVDLNAAEWPELMLLPGIGETMARRIVDWRHQHGPYRSATDLAKVPGIGSRTVERLAGHVTYERVSSHETPGTVKR
jgi:competence protein ComEA